MGNLLFWLGIGTAQKGAGSKPMERRHWVASLIVGILIAELIFNAYAASLLSRETSATKSANSGLLHRSKGFSFDHLVSGTERKTPAIGAGVS
jgi:hypothetical protein